MYTPKARTVITKACFKDHVILVSANKARPMHVNISECWNNESIFNIYLFRNLTFMLIILSDITTYYSFACHFIKESHFLSKTLYAKLQ